MKRRVVVRGSRPLARDGWEVMSRSLDGGYLRRWVEHDPRSLALVARPRPEEKAPKTPA